MNLCYTVRINTAHGPCGVRKAADYFFKSSAGGVSDLLDFPFAACPLALEAEEEDFRHSLAVCPTPLQKRQRLFGKRRAHSATVSLPSFLILSSKSDFFFSEF